MKIGKYGFKIELQQQWGQWFKIRRYNWVNFAPIHIEVEAGWYKGTYIELTFRILGLGFYAELYDQHERNEVIAKAVELRDDYLRRAS